MGWGQHYRITYNDYIRKIVGDPDGVLFTDDELLSSFHKWSSTDVCVTNITWFHNRARISACGCSSPPVAGLFVSTGVDGAVYILDEPAGTVHFSQDDVGCVAAAPADGTTVGVTYYTVNTSSLVSELFFILSSNHAKLKLAHNIMGVGMDLKALADSFYQQACKWKCEECAW